LSFQCALARTAIVPRISKANWQVLSPLLDELLDSDVERRVARLAEIRGTDVDLANDLSALLDSADALEHQPFLEGGVINDLPVVGLQGQVIGTYTLERPIGQGGMGTVWLARRNDGRFEGHIAIKLLNLGLLDQGAARFRREGSILARLDHAHIARLLDAGVTAGGQPYLLLEYVHGEPIDRWCNSRKLDTVSRIRLFLDVADAVAEAHRQLVVHRDLKPANILVTADGQVKLLDFGIAKLLEEDGVTGPATALTMDGAQAVTPYYAAPEQLTGAPATTATDVHALGMLLFLLLTGQHPMGAASSPAAMMRAIVDDEPKRASDAVADTALTPDVIQARAAERNMSPAALRRVLQGDIDTIIAKALKKAPHERYASVTAMGDDLRRYLAHEPISARRDAITYRAAKFVRRNRLAVASAVVILAGLSMGVYAVNRQRAIAEQRFEQVRELANRLFDVDRQVQQLPGNSRARQLIVDTSLEYLQRLSTEVDDDPDLALDIGTAYMRVARVQGVPIAVNLGQMDKAAQNLRTADSLVDSVLAAQPGNRTAFLRKAQITHDRMTLAGLQRPDDGALPLARESARWLDKYLDAGIVAPADAEQVVITLNNVANRFRIAEQFDEALRLIGRGIDVARSVDRPGLDRQMGNLLIGRERIHRDRGALDEALQDIREATRILEPPSGATEYGRTTAFTLALTEAGEILGGDSGVNLDRPEEAITFLERAYQIVDGFAHKDPNDADSRGRVSSAGRPLAHLLRRTDASRALAVFDHVLDHLAEIKNNTRFRRDEVRALAGAAYALQQIGRPDEARQRLDAAFDRLKELGQYPKEQIDLGSEAHEALRALADHQAANGDVNGGIATWQDLLDRVLAASPKPESNLADAYDVSQLQASLAVLHRRAGRPDLAASFDTRRRELWQHWDRKLQNNAFVRRQLAAIPPPQE
jgi:serine/threonine-protein kinase